MATPTDQRDQARHPEDFVRPDDRNAEIMRTWTGIGAPANKYEWDRNRAHGSQLGAAPAPLRPLEKLERGPEITEFVPEPQEQRDPWSLTDATSAEARVSEPLSPTEPTPRGTPVTEYVPPPQPQRDPWELTAPRRVETVPSVPLRPTEELERAPAIVEYVPDPQPQHDPWSLTRASRGTSTAGSTADGVPKTR